MSEYDYSKLRGRMVEKFGSVQGFADKIGIAVQTIISKLNGKKTITKKDIVLWCEVLGIVIDDIGLYFFTPKV